MTAPAAHRPRYSPRVEIQLHEGPQFIAGLAGMLLALVDLDTEREKAAAAGDQDQQFVQGGTER